MEGQKQKGVKKWKRGTTQEREGGRRNKMADSKVPPATALPVAHTGEGES